VLTRPYTLETRWRVVLGGEYLGEVRAVADGYQAVPAGGEPMYPHLPADEQGGWVHGTLDSAAEELVQWTGQSIVVDQGGSSIRGTLEVAS
jgi:hypothetical protein